MHADVALRLMKLRPVTDYITEEFAIVMFKPLVQQCCRVVQFDFQGTPLYCASA